MALLNIDYLPYLVVAADGADHSIIIDAPHSYQAEKKYKIVVTVGTIQFCVGGLVKAQSPVYAVDDVLEITVIGKTEIHYNAAAATNAFIITG
jgi:hypothetical protein